MAGMTPNAYSNMYFAADVNTPWEYAPYDMDGQYLCRCPHTFVSAGHIFVSVVIYLYFSS
jgi:hypothetical protein